MSVKLNTLNYLAAFCYVSKFFTKCFIFIVFSEYLAVFKKTVQVHEVFLQRLSSHPVLSKDRNFQIFLEYDQDVSNADFFSWLVR